MASAPRLGLGVASLALVAISLVSYHGVSHSDDLLVRRGIPDAAPDGIVADRFVVEFKGPVARGLKIWTENGRPQSNPLTIGPR